MGLGGFWEKEGRGGCARLKVEGGRFQLSLAFGTIEFFEDLDGS